MIVSPDELREMCAHAEAEFPYECVGVVMTRGAERKLLRCTNDQNELHRRNPEQYPRDARSAYHVHITDHNRMGALFAQGFELDVIYHSHPNVGAYFSPTDRRQAAPVPDREPLWPGTTYVVVAVNDGTAEEYAAFRWDASARDFAEVCREKIRA